MLQFLAAGDLLDDVLPHPITWLHWHGLYVTNHMAMAVFSALITIAIFLPVFRKIQIEAPTGTRNFLEAMLEFFRIEIIRPALKEHTDRFMPFLWTLFFFILVCNLIGQIPVDAFVSLVTGKESYIWGTPTGNFSITLGLAVCAFICIHVNGIVQVSRDLRNGTYGHHPHHEEHSSNGKPGHEAAQDLEHMRGEALGSDEPSDFRALCNPTAHYGDDEPKGHKESTGYIAASHGQGTNPVLAWSLSIPLYLWNFAPHPFRPGPGQTKWLWVGDLIMWFFLLLIDLFGAVIKAFALFIRLFANMVSGHLVLAALIFLIPLTSGILTELSIGVPVTLLSLLIRLMEVFVAFLQAYIFVFLTTLFLASAIAPEH